MPTSYTKETKPSTSYTKEVKPVAQDESYLLKEDAFYLLLETGDKIIIIDANSGTVYTKETKPSTSYTKETKP